MKIFNMAILACCALLVACGGGGSDSQQAAQAEVVLPLIEFYGDSVQWGYDSATKNRVEHAPSDYVNVPGYTVANWAVSGTATSHFIDGMANRLPWSTLVRQSRASIVLINFGLNDSGLMSVAQYANNLRQIADDAKAAGKVMIFETPTPSSWPNMDLYVQAMRDVATEKAIPLIDRNAYLTSVIGSQPLTDFMPDEVHPNQATYTLIGQFDNDWLNTYLRK